MQSAYKQIEAIILPQITNFKEDVTVFDKKTLSTYKGKFLYGIRESGTTLLKLDAKNVLYDCTKEQMTNMFSNSLHSIKYPNKKFYFFDGQNLSEINSEAMLSIFGLYTKEIYYMKEKIDELKIESLAYVLLAEMQKTKNWRESIQTSENSELRRIKNNFNFYKFKKSETIEEVKEQLYKYCNLLN